MFSIQGRISYLLKHMPATATDLQTTNLCLEVVRDIVIEDWEGLEPEDRDHILEWAALQKKPPPWKVRFLCAWLILLGREQLVFDFYKQTRRLLHAIAVWHDLN